MIQKMIIPIDAKKLLNQYDENHVLLYDANKKCYFAKSKDELLKMQDEKIKQLENIIKVLKKENDEFQTQLATQNQTFKEEVNQRFASFLETYQETNQELIRMVKSLMEGN